MKKRKSTQAKTVEEGDCQAGVVEPFCKGTLQNPGSFHYIWQHVATAEPPVCTIGHGEQPKKYLCNIL